MPPSVPLSDRHEDVLVEASALDADRIAGGALADAMDGTHPPVRLAFASLGKLLSDLSPVFVRPYVANPAMWSIANTADFLVHLDGRVKRLNLAATLAWLAAVPIAWWAGWFYSIAFISAASIYANFASHLAAWRSDVYPHQDQLDRIERLLEELTGHEAVA